MAEKKEKEQRAEYSSNAAIAAFKKFFREVTTALAAPATALAETIASVAKTPPGEGALAYVKLVADADASAAAETDADKKRAARAQVIKSYDPALKVTVTAREKGKGEVERQRPPQNGLEVIAAVLEAAEDARYADKGHLRTIHMALSRAAKRYCDQSVPPLAMPTTARGPKETLGSKASVTITGSDGKPMRLAYDDPTHAALFVACVEPFKSLTFAALITENVRTHHPAAYAEWQKARAAAAARK